MFPIFFLLPLEVEVVYVFQSYPWDSLLLHWCLSCFWVNDAFSHCVVMDITIGRVLFSSDFINVAYFLFFRVNGLSTVSLMYWWLVPLQIFPFRLFQKNQVVLSFLSFCRFEFMFKFWYLSTLLSRLLFSIMIVPIHLFI